MLRRWGFTLVELLVALALGGLVAAAVARVLLDTHRQAQWLAQRIELNHNLRAAVSMLPADLRILDPSDPAGSDIIEMSDSSISYKVLRTFHTTCRPGRRGRLFLDTAGLGSRPPDAEHDSLLVFSDGDPLLTTDDRWVHVDLRAATAGRSCPGGLPSLDLSISPPVAGPDSPSTGNPVLSFEIAQVRSYVDATGLTWLGARRHHKRTGWATLQPVAGPLQPGGLRFSYFTREGAPTRDPARVARIGIAVTGRTPLAVWLASGGFGYLADSLSTQAALRNRK